MKKPNYIGLEPLDLHTCEHCQHLAYDIDKGHVCLQGGHVVNRTFIHYVNDCEFWKSPFLSDYRRRSDLENELKK